MTDVALPDGGRLSITVRGDGPLVLLLRPVGGSVASWEPFATILSARLRVVAFDPRGAGCSSAAPWRSTTRVMAGDARAVLDALGIDRAHVYGLSLGGMVATWLAIEAPARVSRLVLASTAISGRSVRHASPSRVLALARGFLRPGRDAHADLATRVLSRRFRQTRPDEVARIRARAQARPASHRGLLALLVAGLLHDVTDRVGEVTSETLVVAGARDALLGVDAQRELAHRLPRARLALVPDAGHDVSAEVPADVATLVWRHCGVA